jgi:hypothetical protein
MVLLEIDLGDTFDHCLVYRRTGVRSLLISTLSTAASQ